MATAAKKSAAKTSGSTTGSTTTTSPAISGATGTKAPLIAGEELVSVDMGDRAVRGHDRKLYGPGKCKVPRYMADAFLLTEETPKPEPTTSDAGGAATGGTGGTTPPAS
jgi:hypothetical protein